MPCDYEGARTLYSRAKRRKGFNNGVNDIAGFQGCVHLGKCSHLAQQTGTLSTLGGGQNRNHRKVKGCGAAMRRYDCELHPARVKGLEQVQAVASPTVYMGEFRC